MDQEVLQGLRTAKRAFPEASFIVFGSQARGTARPDSDIDLCALFPTIKGDTFELAYSVRNEIHQYLDKALDVVICDESRFHTRSQEPWTLEFAIARDGIRV